MARITIVLNQYKVAEMFVEVSVVVSYLQRRVGTESEGQLSGAHFKIYA